MGSIEWPAGSSLSIIASADLAFKMSAANITQAG
jgi:hypothetical protein